MPQPPIDKEHRERLIAAGINDRFIQLAISGFGDVGQRLLTVFDPEQVKQSVRVLHQGILALLYGKGARELAYTLAGGLLITFSAAVKAVHLSRLADLLDDRKYEELALLQSADVLVVSEFCTPCANPLSPRTIFRVEAFLLERTEIKGRTLILCGEVPIAKANGWSAKMVQRINESFISEEVATYARIHAQGF
jgi:hypothetical protein